MNRNSSEITSTWVTGTLVALILTSTVLGCRWLPDPKPPEACVTAKTYDGPNPPEPGSPAAQILGCWAKDGESEFVYKYEDGYMDVIDNGDSFRGKTAYSFIDRSTIQFGNPRYSSDHVSRCAVETEENNFTMVCKGKLDSKTKVQRFRRLYSASFYEPPANTNSKESK